MRTGCVSFDAMSLKEGLWWNNSTGAIEGFEDIESILHDDVSLEKVLTKGEAKVASELLVFWFTGFGREVKFSHPVGHFYVHKTVNTTHIFLFFHLFEKTFNSFLVGRMRR